LLPWRPLTIAREWSRPVDIPKSVDLGVPVEVHEEVGRLDVAVHHALLLVQEHHPLKHLLGHGGQNVLGDGLGDPHDVCQRSTVHVLQAMEIWPLSGW